MSFDFEYVYLGHSNLGGQGPDTSAPPTIRYINAASVFQPDVGTTYIDLEVSATSSYQPDEASLNGLSGRFARIQPRVQHGSDAARSHAPLVCTSSELQRVPRCGTQRDGENRVLRKGLRVLRQDGVHAERLHGCN